MRVFYKYGLFRVVAFAVVGIVIIVSTQLLRGQNPAEATDKIRQLIRTTILALVQEPVVIGEAAASDVQSSSAVSQTTASFGTTQGPATEVLTFAADQTNAPTLEIPENCQKANASTGATVIGDKIQFRFFAKVGVPKLESDGSATALLDQVAFERLDLSGVYDVAEDGTIALPLIGRLNLVGQTLACAEALVASEVAAQDTSVSAVTAAFSARLPVTISGAVSAPGSYAHTPSMTVNRLLNLAGARFIEGPITPQEFESLVAQRDEILHRQILGTLELGRLTANLAGKDSIDIGSGFGGKIPASVVSSLIDAEGLALRLDMSVSQMTDKRNAVAITGLNQKLEDTSNQLVLTETQIATLKSRHDEMTTFKTRGLIQGSQLDLVLSNLMELLRIKMQLVTEQSNLSSQIKLAEEDARLTIEQRQQDLSRRASIVSGEIGLFDLQIAAIETRLARHGVGSEGANLALPLVVSVQRNMVGGPTRFEAALDTPILPGDMLSVSLSTSMAAKQVTAANDNAGADDALVPELLQK